MNSSFTFECILGES